MKKNKCYLLLFFISSFHYSQSGGALSSDQAAYDVNYYDLKLNIHPDSRTINGSLLCRVKILNQIKNFILDLDSCFTVDSIQIKINNAEYSTAVFKHLDGKINITVPGLVSYEDILIAKIFYRGAPRIALAAPWISGFVWGSTSSTGKPWIGVACESEGADIWWPCKDHPSDEPDSMSLSFTVPNPLICVSNGRFLGSIDNGDNTTTYNWFVSTPINNYNVTFYAAEYMLIEDEYQSISGLTTPFYFWVLPEYYEKAVAYMDVFKREFDFLESICGPFPFSVDKHGWAQAPYAGMEHQTIIAYGDEFNLVWGYDCIHYHELAHEWWGNLITAKDWSDIWIHEGLATYMEALYVESIYGVDSFHLFVNRKRPGNTHKRPLAPRVPMTADEAFDFLNPYSRGSATLHTLRYHLGDELFFKLLKRWAYPDSTDFDNTNGRLCRIVKTDDMKNLAEEVTGRDLDPFFEAFFRRAAYPTLRVERGINETVFKWITLGNIPLDVNIPISVNGVGQTVVMINGQGSAPISINDNLAIDSRRWILMASPTIVSCNDDDMMLAADYKLEQNYPNPFNPVTKIIYSLPKRQFTTLKIFDALGREVSTLVNGETPAGVHEVDFNGSGLSSGIYFYRLQTDEYTETKKLNLLK